MLKNITLSAETTLIEKARIRASKEKITINALFRLWLARYVGSQAAAQEYQQVMDRLSHVKPGKKLSREEMNER